VSENNPQDPNVVKAFKKRKMLFNILWYAGCIFVAVGLLSRRNGVSYVGLPQNMEPWLLLGAAVVLLAGAIFAWRCPVCGKFFWVSTRVFSCSKCKTVFAPESKRGFW
jgi:hypothetical protein